MKNAMCYSGIIIIIIFILLPPILRLTVPDIIFEENIKSEIVRKNLRCSSDRYSVTTSYDNDVINLIVIKKYMSKEELEQDTNPDIKENDTNTNVSTPSIDNASKIDFDNVFERLKEQKNSEVIVQDDGEVISFDFSVSDNSQYDIAKIIQPFEEQQRYYESQNMSCSILT